jgi:uncharacterized protein YndB with AHSA1/START domain
MGQPSSSQVKPFVITHELDAPRDLAFKVWTEAEHLKHWMSPKGFAMTKCENDLRPGGTFHYCLGSPDGKEMWGKWTYREIVPPERIVLVNSFSDENKGLTRHPFSASWPLEMLTTSTLTENNRRTSVRLEWIPLNPTDEERATFDGAHDGMKMGWGGTFEHLDAYIATLTK